MHIIVIIGAPNNFDRDRNRFKDERKKFLKRLLREFGFTPQNGFTYELLGGFSKSISKSLEMTFLERQKEDILLYYIGHGVEDGWALDGYAADAGGDILKYEDLALLLALHHKSIIFLNACCYALAAKEALSKRAGDFLFIGAMPANIQGPIFNFSNAVLDCWKNRLPYHGVYSDAGGQIECLEYWEHTELWMGNDRLNELMYPVLSKTSFQGETECK